MSKNPNRLGRFLTDSAEDQKRIATGLSMAEVCVNDMIEAGYTDIEIATAMGQQMMRHIVRAIPDKRLRDIWLDFIEQMETL